MLSKRVSGVVLAAACVGVLSASVQAAPFVAYSLLGRIAGSSDAFSSSVTVSTGSAVEYQLVPTFVAPGAVNFNLTMRTLTSVGATDGFNSLPRIDLFQSAGAAIDAQFTSTATFPAFNGTSGSSTFGAGTGASGGSPNAGDLMSIRAISNAGNFCSTGTPVVTGTMSIASVTGTSSLVSLRTTNQSAANAGGFRVHINNSTATQGSLVQTSDATETGAQPYWTFNNLQLVKAQTNLSPSFTLASGLQAGDTGIDVTLDVVQPVNSLTHFATFSIPDSLITDEAASTTTVSLGTLPTALQGHVTMSGTRSIVISGSYSDYPALVGTYTIPLVLSDSGSPAGSSPGALTVSVVPEPASLGLMSMSGALLLRRRRRSGRRALAKQS